MANVGKIVALSLAVALVLAGSAVAFLSYQAGQRQATQRSNVTGSLDGFIASKTVSKTYHTLPPQNQSEFLKTKGAYYGLSQNEPATPKALTAACLQQRQRELSAIVAANRQMVDEFKTQYLEAAQKSRAYCYATFSETGAIPVEDTSPNMKH